MTGSVYFAGEGSIESLECTKEFVGRGGRWAWKFVVPEVDGVADGQGAGVLTEHLVAPIVLEGWADVESFPTAVVP